MDEFVEVKPSNVLELKNLATEIWNEFWPEFLSENQIEYMLEKFQSEKALKSQIKNDNYIYYIIHKDSKQIGYFGVKIEEEYLFLSKLYILKEYRNVGIGKRTLIKIKNLAIENNRTVVFLTVNKNNDVAIDCYKNWGFTIVDNVVTDIGKGFVMDDFIMACKV